MNISWITIIYGTTHEQDLDFHNLTNQKNFDFVYTEFSMIQMRFFADFNAYFFFCIISIRNLNKFSFIHGR